MKHFKGAVKRFKGAVTRFKGAVRCLSLSLYIYLYLSVSLYISVYIYIYIYNYIYISLLPIDQLITLLPVVDRGTAEGPPAEGPPAEGPSRPGPWGRRARGGVGPSTGSIGNMQYAIGNRQ